MVRQDLLKEIIQPTFADYKHRCSFTCYYLKITRGYSYIMSPFKHCICTYFGTALYGDEVYIRCNQCTEKFRGE